MKRTALKPEALSPALKALKYLMKDTHTRIRTLVNADVHFFSLFSACEYVPVLCATDSVEFPDNC